MHFLYLVLLLLCSQRALQGHLLPDYDKNCDYLNAPRSPIVLADDQQEVEKIIHQIWFGDLAKKPKKTEEWKGYTELGYQYFLWNEEGFRQIADKLAPKNVALIEQMLSQKEWWGASDIFRYELMRLYGGLYVDCDFHPPRENGKLVPLHKIFASRGLSFVTEHHGRNIGAGNASFFMNGILCAPKNHFFYQYLCEQVSENCAKWLVFKKKYSAMYCTGPFFLNKSFHGSAHVVMISCIDYLGMTAP